MDRFFLFLAAVLTVTTDKHCKSHRIITGKKVSKKTLRNFIITICIGVTSLFATHANAQSVSEFAAIDSLQVGDIFGYTIVLDRNKEYDKIIFPDSSNFGDVFDIRSRKQYQASSFKDSVAYKIQFFGTADTTIPQLPVMLILGQDTTTQYTNPVPIRFSSVLSEQEQSFRPLKPIFAFASAWWPYILGGLLLIGAGCYWYYYYYYQKQEETKEPESQPSFQPTAFTNPITQLQQSIKKLEDANPQTQEEFKQFYITLGDAIRQYYESTYTLPALESTSRELLLMLKKRAVDDKLLEDTKAVLQEADMVKFANFTPTTKQANRAIAKANQFLGRASEVDSPRIDYLRRRHRKKMEKKRRRFQQEQQETTEGEA
ncbi:hypothetical protein LX73_0331 [Fodinibius salinus]|uniref:Oxygen tolerance n=1 Tax=Fodinibius salinus TaxID=860790 RepID=A0A5D3YLJ3_9BACT|nr:hypothetical protein [Fodinibius salinus]TYP95036.1 hypothetical protein LX73_0331 [Fodinibius salinus]